MNEFIDVQELESEVVADFENWLAEEEIKNATKENIDIYVAGLHYELADNDELYLEPLVEKILYNKYLEV